MIQKHNPPYSDELLQLINRKSGLIISANTELDRINGDGQEKAKHLFLQAAQLEQKVIQQLVLEGHKEDIYISFVSAASCYKMAGMYEESLKFFKEALLRDGLPDGMKGKVIQLVQECEGALKRGDRRSAKINEVYFCP